MSLKKMGEEYRSTPKSEIRQAVLENFIYGLLGSIIVVFVTSRIDIAVLISYIIYFFFVGKVINRPKYITSLGKFIMFPIPTALGAFTGYKLALYISMLLH
jgi:hypothetical protein